MTLDEMDTLKSPLQLNTLCKKSDTRTPLGVRGWTLMAPGLTHVIGSSFNCEPIRVDSACMKSSTENDAINMIIYVLTQTIYD